MVEIWIAYYQDWSDLAVFTDELSALRYAVEKSMQVARVKEGVSLRNQV